MDNFFALRHHLWLTGRPTERSQFKGREVSFIYPFLNVHHRCVCVCVWCYNNNHWTLFYSDTRFFLIRERLLTWCQHEKKNDNIGLTQQHSHQKNSNVTEYSILKFALKNTSFYSINSEFCAPCSCSSFTRTSAFTRIVLRQKRLLGLSIRRPLCACRIAFGWGRKISCAPPASTTVWEAIIVDHRESAVNANISL